MQKPYTYVIVRQDIPPAQQMVQACHAAHHAAFKLGGEVDTSNLIVCTVPDEPSLEAAHKRMARYGIECVMFFEPDRNMGHSALGTKPIVDKSQRHAMKIYPLFSPA